MKKYLLVIEKTDTGYSAIRPTWMVVLPRAGLAGS
jgi:hypothetical protein